MIIGERLYQLRESKNLSQGDIQQRSGLLRCYISRVENGHTIPSVETLEKMARALEVPIYQLFHEGDTPPQKLKLTTRGRNESLWGMSPKERRELKLFAKALSRMNKRSRDLLMKMAITLADRRFQGESQ